MESSFLKQDISERIVHNLLPAAQISRADKDINI